MYEAVIPLLVAIVFDWWLGDPSWLPHPIVGFGKMIAFGEKHLNKGRCRLLKGALMALSLIALIFAAVWFLLFMLPPLGRAGVGALLIFFCLAGTTLKTNVRVDLVLAVTLRNCANRALSLTGTTRQTCIRNYICHIIFLLLLVYKFI